MNDKQDEINDRMKEAYRVHLEFRSKEELIEYFRDMTMKQLIDFILETNDVGKGDCSYEA